MMSTKVNDVEIKTQSWRKWLKVVGVCDSDGEVRNIAVSSEYVFSSFFQEIQIFEYVAFHLFLKKFRFSTRQV